VRGLFPSCLILCEVRLDVRHNVFRLQSKLGGHPSHYFRYRKGGHLASLDLRLLTQPCKLRRQLPVLLDRLLPALLKFLKDFCVFHVRLLHGLRGLPAECGYLGRCLVPQLLKPRLPADARIVLMHPERTRQQPSHGKPGFPGDPTK
jgi:hypothetical protein